MNRKDKYPDTSVFHFYNANPKGKYTTDCLFRAISTATEIPYETVVREMTELHLKTGLDTGDKKLYSAYLKEKGWIMNPQPRKANNTKFTGKEFCKYIQSILSPIHNLCHKRIFAHIGGGHVVAIVTGRIYDTWDSSDGCIGNYWVKW